MNTQPLRLVAIEADPTGAARGAWFDMTSNPFLCRTVACLTGDAIRGLIARTAVLGLGIVGMTVQAQITLMRGLGHGKFSGNFF